MKMLSVYIADSVKKLVERKLGTNNNGHDIQHIERVLNNASKIIADTGANEKIVYTSIYLHDLIDYKVTDNQEKEIEDIKQILGQSNYTNNEIDEIIDIISSISFSKHKTLTTINQMIVSDADKLDALGAIGIIRTIQYGQSVNRPFYEEANLLRSDKNVSFNESTLTSLSHFYDKLLKLPNLMYTNRAKEIAYERVKIINDFLESFYNEIK